MIDLKKLASQLKADEGVRSKPYKDTVGKLTIGVGRNLDDVGLMPSEIDLMLQNDIKSVINDLDNALPWWRQMSENRQGVLANMCFNMGIGDSKRGLLSFKNTLAAMKSGNYEAAARGMELSKWAIQVGNRATRLIHEMRQG